MERICKCKSCFHQEANSHTDRKKIIWSIDKVKALDKSQPPLIENKMKQNKKIEKAEQNSGYFRKRLQLH